VIAMQDYSVTNPSATGVELGAGFDPTGVDRQLLAIYTRSRPSRCTDSDEGVLARQQMKPQATWPVWENDSNRTFRACCGTAGRAGDPNGWADNLFPSADVDHCEHR
jgi:hypothetical protein